VQCLLRVHLLLLLLLLLAALWRCWLCLCCCWRRRQAPVQAHPA
jgi:hypothetical protein